MIIEFDLESEQSENIKPVLQSDLYDTTCMTHNRFSGFHCVYTFIQVVHSGFIKFFFL